MGDKLVSMKMSKSEREEKSQPAELDRPLYPYGLEVRLDTDALEKLGLETLPEVGDDMTLLAKVKITGASSSDSEYGKNYKSPICVSRTATRTSPPNSTTADRRSNAWPR